MIYDPFEMDGPSCDLPAVWVHAGERLTEDFDGIEAEGVCACAIKEKRDKLTAFREIRVRRVT